MRCPSQKAHCKLPCTLVAVPVPCLSGFIQTAGKIYTNFLRYPGGKAEQPSRVKQGRSQRTSAPTLGLSLAVRFGTPLPRVSIPYFRDSPLNELALKRPSEVISRYSTSATKVGSTHVALGFRIALVSLDLGLTTVSSCFRIWLETVRDHPVPTLPI